MCSWGKSGNTFSNKTSLIYCVVLRRLKQRSFYLFLETCLWGTQELHIYCLRMLMRCLVTIIIIFVCRGPRVSRGYDSCVEMAVGRADVCGFCWAETCIVVGIISWVDPHIY